MVKPRNKEPPPAAQSSGSGSIATPPPEITLTTLSTSDYNALITRLQRLEAYVGSLAQTYEIRNPQGELVVF
jgi:hypothetical protein